MTDDLTVGQGGRQFFNAIFRKLAVGHVQKSQVLDLLNLPQASLGDLSIADTQGFQSRKFFQGVDSFISNLRAIQPEISATPRSSPDERGLHP